FVAYLWKRRTPPLHARVLPLEVPPHVVSLCVFVFRKRGRRGEEKKHSRNINFCILDFFSLLGKLIFHLGREHVSFLCLIDSKSVGKSILVFNFVIPSSNRHQW